MGDYLPDIPEGQVSSTKILPNGLVASRLITPGWNGFVGSKRIDGNPWPFKYDDLGRLSGYTPGLIGSTGPLGYNPTPVPNSTTRYPTPLADSAAARGLGARPQRVQRWRISWIV